jgi:hypothetical protein
MVHDLIALVFLGMIITPALLAMRSEKRIGNNLGCCNEARSTSAQTEDLSLKSIQNAKRKAASE